MPSPRLRFARLLRGRGLEIGALNRPTPLPDGASVTFSDLLSPEDIAKMYPGAVLPEILSDSETFPTVADGTFDFLIANHVLEHVTDPIQALCEWHRIVRDGGLVLMALPDKRFTFDHGRQRTALAHLIEDHVSPLSPRLKNLPHLVEWATHVERLPVHSPEWAAFIEAQFDSCYMVHNHVWVVEDVLALLAYLNRRRLAPFELLRWANTRPRGDEFVLLLRVRKRPGAAARALHSLRLRAAILTAWLQAPAQLALAAGKRAYRARPTPETPPPAPRGAP